MIEAEASPDSKAGAFRSGQPEAAEPTLMRHGVNQFPKAPHIQLTHNQNLLASGLQAFSINEPVSLAEKRATLWQSNAAQ